MLAMTTTLRARFDGKVFVPEAPVELPADTVVDFSFTTSLPKETQDPPLMRLVEAAKHLPPDPNSPGDAAEQHDHYLYGTPKRKSS